jgi:alanyl-tRNA synthetase
MTVKVYHRDAYARTCASTVTGVRDDGGRSAVALAETVFYAAAGGQPADQGTLDAWRVDDVREEEGVIWHVLVSRLQTAPELQAAPAPLPAIGATVTGSIDWPRRFDHMQQHTGQHILSQAFVQIANAATTSVHMDRTCTLDLAVPSLDDDTISRVEALANAIVMEARPVTVRTVDGADVDALGLRRPPKQSGPLRVVEIDQFDRSACGGTHVRVASEVSAIVIAGWERYKGGVRVQFLCGWRVWREFRRMRRVLVELAGRLTTGEDDLPAAVARLHDHARGLERKLAEARAVVLDREAERLLEEAGTAADAVHVIAQVHDDRTIDEVRHLARLLTGRAPCVVALAVDPGRRLLVARSAGVNVDAGAILKDALAAHGGRGGGRAESAEGAAPAAPSSQALADAAAAAARRALSATRG